MTAFGCLLDNNLIRDYNSEMKRLLAEYYLSFLFNLSKISDNVDFVMFRKFKFDRMDTKSKAIKFQVILKQLPTF